MQRLELVTSEPRPLSKGMVLLSRVRRLKAELDAIEALILSFLDESPEAA